MYIHTVVYEVDSCIKLVTGISCTYENSDTAYNVATMSIFAMDIVSCMCVYNYMYSRLVD